MYTKLLKYTLMTPILCIFIIMMTKNVMSEENSKDFLKNKPIKIHTFNLRSCSLIEGKIFAEPSEYILEQLLSISITASEPGWGLKIKAKQLKGDGSDKIPSSEIYLVQDDDRWIPLSKYQTLVEDGRDGKIGMTFRIGLKTLDYHSLGHYGGELMLVTTVPHGPDPSTRHIPIELDVKSEVSHAIRDNKVYFHVGNPMDAKDMAAHISGEVDTECPVSLLLSVEEDSVGALRFIQSFDSVRQTNVPDPIPVIWELKENGSRDFRDPDFGDISGQEAGWHLQKTPGFCQYDLKCRINPLSYQPSGEYGLKVQISLVPNL